MNQNGVLRGPRFLLAAQLLGWACESSAPVLVFPSAKLRHRGGDVFVARTSYPLFFPPPAWRNYIWLAFVRLTDPVVRLVRFITPAELPDVLVLVFAFFWLMAARLSLLALLASLNLLPTIAAGGG